MVSGSAEETGRRLTSKQREALRLLREHGDPVIGLGGGVVCADWTGLDSGQPWINWRTAYALERRGLAKVSRDPYDDYGEITLTEAGLASPPVPPERTTRDEPA